MAEESDAELAKAWIALQYSEQQSEAHASNFWAHTRLDDLVRSDPERSWIVIKAIQAEDNTDFILSNLAAGPLEDLLVRWGDHFAPRFEALAKNDTRFRFLLGLVWKNEISESVWARIRRAVHTGH
jgi:hypothetical protein